MQDFLARENIKRFEAKLAGAAYLVMGGYGHSRIGELVFGGVTRSLLKEGPLPLVIAR